MARTVLVVERWTLLLTKLVPMPVGMAWRGSGAWGEGWWGRSGRYPIDVSCSPIHQSLITHLLLASRRHCGRDILEEWMKLGV